MRTRWRTALLALAVAVAVLAAGNLLYLLGSTYRVDNRSHAPATVDVFTGSPPTLAKHVATVDAGERGRGWLPIAGEATIEVRTATSSCRAYVEPTQYHLEVAIDGAGQVRCASKLAGFFDLGLLNLVP